MLLHRLSEEYMRVTPTKRIEKNTVSKKKRVLLDATHDKAISFED